VERWVRGRLVFGVGLGGEDPVADSQQAAIDGAAEIRALLRSEPR